MTAALAASARHRESRSQAGDNAVDSCGRAADTVVDDPVQEEGNHGDAQAGTGRRGRPHTRPVHRDTLRDLHAERGEDAEFYFITGADALSRMLSWQDVDELFTLAHFVGCTRPGHRLTDRGLPEDKVSLVEIPALAISSTGCRQRVAKGQPIWYLVPDGIVQYIAKRGLYQNGGV